LVACWNAAPKSSVDLSAFLWAAARCAPADGPGRLLTPVCNAWSALPDEAEKEEGPSPRNDLAAHGIDWAFWRGLPDAAVRYFIERAALDDLRWPISYMLHGMDHPDAVEFIAREVGAIARRLEGGDSFSLFAMIVRNHWNPSSKHGRRMSDASRNRLRALWTDSHDVHLRREAFRIWATGVYADDLPLLRSMPESDLIADNFLAARLRVGDRAAIPELLPKLREAKHRSYWWQSVPNLWSDELMPALDGEFMRRRTEA
jgi:hypothetical protein